MNTPHPTAQVFRFVTSKAQASSTDAADTVDALEHLLHEARGGGLVGLVFGVKRANGTFLVDARGACLKDPMTARGIVATIDDDLAEIIRDRMADE